MELIEIDYNEKIVCPYCGETLIDNDNPEPFKICEHTIFVLTDESIEFVRKDLENIINKDLIGSSSHDEFTKSLEIEGVVRIAQYAPSPSAFGVYFGFNKTT